MLPLYLSIYLSIYLSEIDISALSEFQDFNENVLKIKSSDETQMKLRGKIW